jgi:hypothetical protein
MYVVPVRFAMPATNDRNRCQSPGSRRGSAVPDGAYSFAQPYRRAFGASGDAPTKAANPFSISRFFEHSIF